MGSQGFLRAAAAVDLAAERRTGDFVRKLIRRGITTAVHDVSGGGFLVALAEMALASDIGIILCNFRGTGPRHAQAFGEDQGRYLVAVSGNDFHYATGLMRDAKIPFFYAGRANGVYFEIPNDEPIPITVLRAGHEGWFPRYMER